MLSRDKIILFLCKTLPRCRRVILRFGKIILSPGKAILSPGKTILRSCKPIPQRCGLPLRRRTIVLSFLQTFLQDGKTCLIRDPPPLLSAMPNGNEFISNSSAPWVLSPPSNPARAKK
jgi:hypothetical protein